MFVIVTKAAYVCLRFGPIDLDVITQLPYPILNHVLFHSTFLLLISFFLLSLSIFYVRICKVNIFITLVQVNGVAQLHSDILKAELFADFVSIWPTKFQNKTNGITPRRWLQFCSPGLSNIITKWLKTDEWVTNLDKLANLRQVRVKQLLKTFVVMLVSMVIVVIANPFSYSYATMKNSRLNGHLQRWLISSVWHSTYCKQLVKALTQIVYLTYK